MAEVVRMPKLSDTMTEGVVAEWHKKVGDKVKSGDLLAEIETDKATMEFESFQEGVLLHIGVEKGRTAAVDSILAILGEKNEDVKAILAKEKAVVVESQEEEVKPPQEQKAVDKVSEPKIEQLPSVKEEKRITNDSIVSNRVKASPLAKKMAKDRGLNLSLVKGTGDSGRIVSRDIESFSGNSSVVQEIEKFTEVSVSQMRKTIAKRLGESKFSAPHFYLTVAIDMSEAIRAREAIMGITGVKVSYNDFVVKAAATALQDHPAVNSSWLGDKIRYNEHIHIGVAVAVDEGLLVPVVRFANGKRLSQISEEVRVFAEKAKTKKLQPQEMQGNTFTISNLGMFGIEEFTAIINPPDACIMAVGGISDVPVVKDGKVVPGKIMKVTLSCDHRVVDGATGAKFLNRFKQLMENPVVLLGLSSI